MSTNLVDECYRRAREARRSAEMASVPSKKTHFLDLERRWLRAAESVDPRSLRAAKVAKDADADQPLRLVQQENGPAVPSVNEISNEQGSGANLSLTMRFGGLEETIPLQVPHDAIAILVLEAQVRDVSVGQLLSTLIEAAMGQDLSQVLDDSPTQPHGRHSR